MADPTPIRPDVEPAIDVAREMRDYAWMQIERHMQNSGGMAPTHIAIVLLGKNGAGEHTSTANSWTPENEQASRLQVCAAAAALLNRRALETK